MYTQRTTNDCSLYVLDNSKRDGSANRLYDRQYKEQSANIMNVPT